MGAADAVSKNLSALNQWMWKYRSKYAAVQEYDYDADSGEDSARANYRPIQWTKDALVALCVSTAAGAVFGLAVAGAVNTALVEVITAPFFGIYFGLLFTIVGGILVWRIRAASAEGLAPDESPEVEKPKRYLLFFACLNIATGVLCFLFETEDLLFYGRFTRLVVFTLLGMSAAFSLTFGAVDLLNLAVGLVRPTVARPLVESGLQIHVVVGNALLMGALFGLMFGLAPVDVSAKSAAHQFAQLKGFHGGRHDRVHLAEVVPPALWASVGLFCGALAGAANEYIRQLENSFHKLDQPIVFDQDI